MNFQATPIEAKWRRSYVIVFVFLLFTFVYFQQGGGSNQNANIGEIREFVEHGTVDITSWSRVTGDISIFKGHFYSNKSPSVFFIAVPIYAAFVMMAKLCGADFTSTTFQFVINGLLTILVACLWGALLGPLLIKLFRRIRPEWSPKITVSLGLMLPVATLVFPYATVGFIHAFETFWAVMVLYQWIVLLDEATDSLRGIFFSVSLGMLVLANPINVPVAALILAYAAWRVVGWNQALRFGCIMIIPLLPLLFYNFWLFGSIFKTNRHFLPSYFSDPSLFLGVYDAPNFWRLVNMFGPGHRSVFPGHVMLLLGFLPGNRQKIRELGVKPLVPALALIGLELVHMLCFNGWHGGWAFGPRYFLPGLMMLVILSSCDAERQWGKTEWALAIGYLAHLIVTSIDMMPSEQIMNPWLTKILPKFPVGPVAEYSVDSFPFNAVGPAKFNLGHVMGLHGWWSLAPLVAIQLLLGFVLLRAYDPKLDI